MEEQITRFDPNSAQLSDDTSYSKVLLLTRITLYVLQHTQSPPAPNLSAKQDDKTAQASLRRILTFLNTSPISKRSPSELAGHHYFAKQERIDIPNEEQLRHDEDDEASRQSRECPSWVDSSIKFATLDLYENFVGSTLQLSVIDVKEDMASDENLHEVAKSYIKVGKLDDADTIYEQGIRFRQAFDPYDIHLLFLHLWRAEVWYKIGKYEDAKRYFGRIQERTEQLQKEGAIDQQDADCLRKDLSWWIALTDFRLGDYLESENILGPITTQEAFSSIVQEPPSSWTENVHIIFRSKRILALNKAKMGYFDVARTYIDDLHKMLGNIVCFDHEDTSAEGKESRTRSTERKKLRKASAILKYTSALVFLLQGRHKTALSEAKSAVEELQHVSGNMSLEVLEARCLEARLLAHNDQVSKAESICEEMLRTMSPNPGPLHPVSLDFTDVLVFTLRRQARLSEALATAEGLCRQCEQAYGRDWAQTYQSKSQLASIHLANGEYRAAVEILRDISSPNSKCDLQRRLRYQAELALALLHFGQHEEAMQRIRHVILDQRSFFSESYRALAPESLVPVRGSKFEESLIELLADLQCKPSQAGKCVLHPDLVFSLETFAIITASTNIEVGTGYMEAVLSMRRSVAELWSDAYAILDTRLMVCLMKRGSGKGYSPSDALTDLIDLVKDMKQFLGPSHPITLAAHCELLLTQAAVSSSRKDLQDQVNQLSGIERQQKFEIGDFHLSTLRTRLAMFVVQLVLDDIQGSSLTCGYLLQSLHDPTVRHQSLVESLNMEEQMALAYYDQGRFEECRRILEDMVSELQDGGGLAGQVEELQLQSFLSHVRGTLKDTLATLADEENASKTSVGEGE